MGNYTNANESSSRISVFTSVSTKAQLRDVIKREARIKSAANLDTLVDDIVADIMRDHCNKIQYAELLKTDVVVTLVNSQQNYDLPTDFQNFDQLRYGRTSTPSIYRVLKPFNPNVKRSYAQGYPFFYRRVGSQILLWPYQAIMDTDQLLLDYYVHPASLYTTEDSVFPVDRLESVVKKEAIARLQRFMSDDQGATITKSDSNNSFVAAQSVKS